MDGLPYYLRFLTKFVFDVLPAALASVIGGFLFTQYHTAPAPERPAIVQSATPAKAEEAMQMVRDEHHLIVDYLKGQQAAVQKRNASFDEARAKATTEAREAAAREAANRETAQREAANREALNREVAEKLAAIKRREVEQAMLRPEPAKPVFQVAAVDPTRAVDPTHVPERAVDRAPMSIAPASSGSASTDFRPPADVLNEPRRVGPIDATVTFARDITGKAVSTVLEIPGWLGDRLLGGGSGSAAPTGRLISSQW